MSNKLQNMCDPRFFKALSDPNRIALFSYLASCCGPTKVGDMCSCCDVDASVISRHLSQLKDAGLLTAEKKGKEVYYSVNTKDVAKSLRDLASCLESCCKPTRKKGGRK